MSDARELARLLGVQQLSLACYKQVLARGVLASLPVRSRALVGEMRVHEAAHVATTRAALAQAGGHAPAPPASLSALTEALEALQIRERPGHLRGTHDAINLLVAIERIAVGAGSLACGLIADGSIAGLAARMAASDAQHVAVLHEQIHPGDIVGAIPYGLDAGRQ